MIELIKTILMVILYFSFIESDLMRCFIKLKYFLLDFIIIIHITYERLKLRGD